MKELYLNNQLCDIDGDFNPTFQFRSFLFARMQGYDAARTWEVSIPLTARNRNIISQAQAVDNATAFPYTTHTVSYYSDGYPIVEAGRAYMVGTTAGRALFVFVLGETLPVLKALSEKKLRELTERAELIYNWNRYSSFADMSGGWGLCNYFNFTNEDRSLTTDHPDIPYGVTHPSILFTAILSLIETEFTISMTDLKTASQLTNVVYPMKSLNGLIDPTVLQPITITPLNLGGTGSLVDAPFSIATNNYIEVEAITDGTTSYTFYPTARDGDSWDLVLNLNLESSTKLFLKQEGAVEYPEILTELPYTNIGGTHPYKYAISNLKIGIKPLRGVSIAFEFEVDFSEIWFENAGTCSVIAGFKKAFYGGLEYGFYPVISNLPDMTCADFINQCCMITGLFPYVNPATPKVLNFYSAKVLSDNAPSAQNWSRYLIKSTDTMGEAEDMKHQLDGFAQNNRMRYADDPTNLLDTSGNLTVVNTNIEKEAELFKLTFAAGKRATVYNNTIDYVLYDVKYTDPILTRTYKEQPLDVIGKINLVDGIYVVEFPDALKFSALQSSTAYLYYHAYIYRPHVLRERFALSARLTSLIDVRIPIYLEQYGKYYAIMEAQVDGDYNADVTLLEV